MTDYAGEALIVGCYMVHSLRKPPSPPHHKQLTQRVTERLLKFDQL